MSVPRDRRRNAGEVGNGGSRSAGHRCESPSGRGSADPDRAGALRRRHRAARHAARRVQAQHRAARPVACRSTCRRRARLPGVVAVYTGEDLPRLTNAAASRRRDRDAPHARAPLRRRSSRSPPTRCATSATRSRWSWPRTATSPRTRSSSSRRTSTSLDPVVTYDDALDDSKPPLFDESTTTSRSRSEMIARRRRRPRSRRPTGWCRRASGCTATSRSRWSAAG